MARKDRSQGETIPVSSGSGSSGRIPGVSTGARPYPTTYDDYWHGKISDPSLYTELLQVLTNGDADDRENQINALNWLMELNKRNYNEQMLQEQRQYDSPTSQLGRLMATGLSRSAALQLLDMQGNSPISTEGAPPAVASGAGMQQQFQEKQLGLSIGATVLSSLASLFTAGISAPAAIASGSLTAANAVAQKYQNQAQEGSAILLTHMYQASRKGLVNLKGKSFDDAISALQAIPQTTDAGLYDYFNSDDGYNALMASPMGYSIASQNYNVRFGNASQVELLRQAKAQTLIQEMQPDQIAASIGKLNADTLKVFEDINNAAADLDIKQELLPLQKSLLGSQIEVNSAQAEQSRAETKQIDTQTRIIEVSAHRLEITQDDLDATALMNAATDLQIAMATGSDEVLKNTLASIVDNSKQMRALAAFNVLRYKDLQTMLNGDSGGTLLHLHTTFETMQLGELFKSYFENMHTDKGFQNKHFDQFLGTFGIANYNRIVQTSKPLGPLNANLFAP